MSSLPFVKMHGLGNDFVVAEAGLWPMDDLPRTAEKVCHRSFGVGADGLIILDHLGNQEVAMSIYNSDGSQSQMCGNGLRCSAIYALRRGWVRDSLRVRLGGGVFDAQIAPDGMVSLEMGRAHISGTERVTLSDGQEFVGTVAALQNPHFIVFSDRLEDVPLLEVGPLIEHHSLFPDRTNVHFAKVLGPDVIQMITWERGAGATLACGSGATCVFAAAFAAGLVGEKAEIRLPGGSLTLVRGADGLLTMIGPAVWSFEGAWLPRSL